MNALLAGNRTADSGPVMRKRATSKPSTIPNASRLCAGPGETARRMKCCSSGIVGSAFFSIAWLFGAPARGLANELRVCAANLLGRRQVQAAMRECYALRTRFRRMRRTAQATRTRGDASRSGISQSLADGRKKLRGLEWLREQAGFDFTEVRHSLQPFGVACDDYGWQARARSLYQS